MNDSLFAAFCKRTRSFDFCVPRTAVLTGIAVLGMTALAAWGGYNLGVQEGASNRAELAAAEVRQLLADERREIADARTEQRAHLDAMALRVAEIQAHLMRLDALGGRLVEVGKLDSEEFDFASPPPMGGIDDSIPADDLSVSELTNEMDLLSALLADREEKLSALEDVLIDRDLMAEVLPSGKPVKKGWISSVYGRRTDPFKGRKSFHRGVDFAGKRGAEVVAVASGVVVRSKRSSGYGNLVEIKHADGYTTLYAHNKENLVKKGDVVNKGQTIALLGSTGRSSGPHVHFEVRKDGKIVNPLRFVRAK